jgi:cell wall-associated NlpC family hydrolase
LFGIVSLFFLVGMAMCYAQPVVVSQPVAHVWVHPRLYRGPFQYPLTLGKGAIPLYTHAFYGELLHAGHKQGKFIQVHVPGQMGTQRGQEEVKPLVGYVDPLVFMRNDAYLRHSPLVVTTPTVSVMDKPDSQTATLITVPFGSVLRQGDVPTVVGWTSVVLVDGNTGFVPANTVSSFDLLLPPLDALRQGICSYVPLFIDQPYCFGGRSIFSPDYLSCADCSGLAHLLYHANGLLISRLAHAQFLTATPVEPKDMQAGDLIFFKRKKKKYLTVTHLALYLGDGKLVEAVGVLSSCLKVHVTTCKDYFGLAVEDLYQGCEIMQHDDDASSRLYFGSFLSTPDSALALRKNFLALQQGDFKAFGLALENC